MRHTGQQKKKKEEKEECRLGIPPFADITSAFRQQYPFGDIPHDPKNNTQTQLSAKLQAVQNKYSIVFTLITPQQLADPFTVST